MLSSRRFFGIKESAVRSSLTCQGRHTQQYQSQLQANSSPSTMSFICFEELCERFSSLCLSSQNGSAPTVVFENSRGWGLDFTTGIDTTSLFHQPFRSTAFTRLSDEFVRVMIYDSIQYDVWSGKVTGDQRPAMPHTSPKDALLTAAEQLRLWWTETFQTRCARGCDIYIDFYAKRAEGVPNIVRDTVRLGNYMEKLLRDYKFEKLRRRRLESGITNEDRFYLIHECYESIVSAYHRSRKIHWTFLLYGPCGPTEDTENLTLFGVLKEIHLSLQDARKPWQTASAQFDVRQAMHQRTLLLCKWLADHLGMWSGQPYGVVQERQVSVSERVWWSQNQHHVFYNLQQFRKLNGGTFKHISKCRNAHGASQCPGKTLSKTLDMLFHRLAYRGWTAKMLQDPTAVPSSYRSSDEPSDRDDDSGDDSEDYAKGHSLWTDEDAFDEMCEKEKEGRSAWAGVWTTAPPQQSVPRVSRWALPGLASLESISWDQVGRGVVPPGRREIISSPQVQNQVDAVFIELCGSRTCFQAT